MKNVIIVVLAQIFFSRLYVCWGPLNMLFSKKDKLEAQACKKKYDPCCPSGKYKLASLACHLFRRVGRFESCTHADTANTTSTFVCCFIMLFCFRCSSHPIPPNCMAEITRNQPPNELGSNLSIFLLFGCTLPLKYEE